MMRGCTLRRVAPIGPSWLGFEVKRARTATGVRTQFKSGWDGSTVPRPTAATTCIRMLAD